MNFAIRQSIKIFITSIIILMIAIVIFYKLNYHSTINYYSEDAKFIAQKASAAIDLHLIGKVKEVKTIIAAPIIINSLSKSNEHYQVLTQEERDKEILQKNKKWKAIKDENNSFILDYTNNEVSKYLKTLQQNIKGEYGEIFLTNKYGALVASTSKLTTFAHGYKYWWKGAFNDGKGSVFLDDRGYDDSVGGYVLGVVIPIKKDNEIIGILKANLNILGSINTIIVNHQIQDHEKLKLIRSGGLIVFEDGIEPLSKRISGNLQKKIQTKQKNSFVIETEGDKFIIGYDEIKISSGMEGYTFGGNFESIDHKKGNKGESWIIIELIPFSNIIEQTTKFVTDLWVVGIILTIIFALTSFILGKKTAKPLKELIKQTKQITKGDYDFKIIVDRDDEIGELALAFNQMTKYLRESTTSITNLNTLNQQLLATEQQLRATNKQLIANDYELKKEKEFSEKIIETATAIIVGLDKNHIIRIFNKGAEIITGYTKAEVLGKDWFKIFFPKEMLNEMNQVWEDAWGIESHSYINPILSKKGKEIIVSWQITGIYDDEDTSKHLLISIGEDITERKKKEKEYLLLSTAVTQSPSVIAITNTEGILEYVNPKFTELTGYTIEEAVGQNPRILKSGELPDEVYVDLWATISSGKEWRGEFHNKKKNGELFWEAAAISPIFDKQGRIINYIKVAKDITEHKLAEEQIKKDLKIQTALIQEIYHRTKNNMAVISAMLSMQARNSDSEYVKSTFREIRNKIKAMSLVHQKLYQANDLSNISLKDYIEDLTKLIMQSYCYLSKKTKLKFDLQDVKISIDSAIPLGLIINELISNIFKHAFPNSQEGEIFIRLFKEDNETINLELSDNGVGFPKDFDPLKDGSMGLASVFSIVENQLKGEISVKSENGLKWYIKIKDNHKKARV